MNRGGHNNNLLLFLYNISITTIQGNPKHVPLCPCKGWGGEPGSLFAGGVLRMFLRQRDGRFKGNLGIRKLHYSH